MTNPSEVLSPHQVAELFGVDPKTVTRWAKAGKLPCFLTIGGHRRYHRSDVQALLHRESTDAAPLGR